VLADPRRRGVRATAGQLSRLYGPVGLDLGAETPGEIAASIVAEILATASGRRAGRLRDQVTPVHDPIPRLTAAEAAFDDVSDDPRTLTGREIKCQTESR